MNERPDTGRPGLITAAGVSALLIVISAGDVLLFASSGRFIMHPAVAVFSYLVGTALAILVAVAWKSL